MVLKVIGRYLSLDIATITLLIPGIRASNTEADAIVDAIEIKNEKLENLDTSKATFKGVEEF